MKVLKKFVSEVGSGFRGVGRVFVRFAKIVSFVLLVLASIGVIRAFNDTEVRGADAGEVVEQVSASSFAPTVSFRPKMRPAHLVHEDSVLAPMTSPRPKARPTQKSSVLSEQIDQTILEVLREKE